MASDPQLLSRLARLSVLDFEPTIVKGHAERLVRVHHTIAESISAFRAHVDRVVQALAKG